MKNPIKDTDYLAVSARIKAMETGLLSRERMEQILEARTDDEALKLLQDGGYPELRGTDPESLNAALSAAREESFADLADSVPDPRYIDVFKLKYDYHNVKVLLKAAAVGADPDPMLADMGRVSVQQLKEALSGGETADLPPMLAAAVQEAREVLDTTRDPQLSDIVLDRWSYRDMLAVADATGSQFLRGYVQVQIDAANLRALVRTIRMGKNEAFLAGVLFEGGEIPPSALLQISADKGAGLKELYEPTRFCDAAACGQECLQGGALTDFERLCDDAVSDYLSGAQFVPFGEAPLVGYLAARETEYTNLRILLTGRGTGLAPEVIRSRLRAV
ncbi:V-type ATPase subunit [uncultured Oscillibacter sp.]|uniref:V-type ATPase subunit n=1 Tax=uncultured Oscillibacter sp. TaxID=876091 RepID=UPI0025ECFD2C|nr:V-type ATPase subunit [uncultured Oscillibacter sp.]